MYAKTSYGPGSIGSLRSGIGLTYGPTIGSNDSRAPIPMRGLQGCCGQGMGITGFTVVPGAIDAAMRARLAKNEVPLDPTVLIDQPITDGSQEPPTDNQPPVEPPTTSPWIWIVGGLGVFALIGGLTWYALK
jgi:hypothetical protein